MKGAERKDLQDRDAWEFDNQAPALRERKARAVVSVAFSREDFERVEHYAREHGLKISEFIREAALQRVERAGATAEFSALRVGGSSQIAAYFEPTTQPVTQLALPFEKRDWQEHDWHERRSA